MSQRESSSRRNRTGARGADGGCIRGEPILGRRALPLLAFALAGCGGAAATGPTTPEEAVRRECTAALRFEEPGAEEAASESDAPPQTNASIVLICEDEETRRVAIGSEVGACFPIEPDRGSLLRARCWWGAQGAVIDVRHEGELLEVRRGAIDETTGAIELRTVTELPIPEDADVRAL